MRFQDARDAGRALAAKLSGRGGRGGGGAVVLALARGGVGVGLEVSRVLGLPLDVLLLRRLLVTRGPLLPGCVASVAGSTFLDEEVASALADGPGDAALAQYLGAALADFDSWVRACRGERPALELKGKTVILVDNGVRTGSTMLAALRALRAMSPAAVVAAAPVADASARDAVAASVEEFHCLATPDPFGHVGLWYADFRRHSDEETRAALDGRMKDEG